MVLPGDPCVSRQRAVGRGPRRYPRVPRRYPARYPEGPRRDPRGNHPPAGPAEAFKKPAGEREGRQQWRRPETGPRALRENGAQSELRAEK
eukprot:2532815-Rhodomonas_salina.1